MHILCVMSCLEGYIFAPAPGEDYGQQSHISVPEVSSLHVQRWGWEPAGGGGDDGSVFAVVAAEAVGFDRSETSPLQHMSLLQIQAGQEEGGVVKTREAIGEVEVEGES